MPPSLGLCAAVCAFQTSFVLKNRNFKSTIREVIWLPTPLPCRNSEDPLGITDPLMKTQALKCYIYTNLAAQVSHSLHGQLQTSTIWGGKNILRSSSETQTQMMQCKLSKCAIWFWEMTWPSVSSFVFLWNTGGSYLRGSFLFLSFPFEHSPGGEKPSVRGAAFI